VGFAIPLTPAKREVIDTLRQGRHVEYGYLGLTVRLSDAAERPAGGLSGARGVIVQQVEPGGPAVAAGVRVGDVLLAYGPTPVTGPAQLAEVVGQTPVGTRVRLETLRGGQPLSLEATVDRRDANRVSWMRGGAVSWRGLRLADVTDGARRRMRGGGDAPEGVVVIGVEADSPAARADVRVGDVVQAVAGQPVEDALSFLTSVRDATDPLELTIRGRGALTVTP
jgi:serine protease Do